MTIEDQLKLIWRQKYEINGKKIRLSFRREEGLEAIYRIGTSPSPLGSTEKDYIQHELCQITLGLIRENLGEALLSSNKDIRETAQLVQDDLSPGEKWKKTLEHYVQYAKGNS